VGFDLSRFFDRCAILFLKTGIDFDREIGDRSFRKNRGAMDPESNFPDQD